MGDLKAVLSALQGAKGGDREVDALIVAALGRMTVKRYPPSDDFGPHDRWQFWSRDGEHFLGSEGRFPVPAYTASVDTALALVAEKLPGHTYLIGRGKTRPEEPLHGVFFSPDGSMKAGPEGSDWPVEVEHESLPICILTALFSALSALNEGGPANG